MRKRMPLSPATKTNKIQDAVTAFQIVCMAEPKPFLAMPENSSIVLVCLRPDALAADFASLLPALREFGFQVNAPQALLT